jgi:hypothetical protein
MFNLQIIATSACISLHIVGSCTLLPIMPANHSEYWTGEFEFHDVYPVHVSQDLDQDGYDGDGDWIPTAAQPRPVTPPPAYEASPPEYEAAAPRRRRPVPSARQSVVQERPAIVHAALEAPVSISVQHFDDFGFTSNSIQNTPRNSVVFPSRTDNSSGTWVVNDSPRIHGHPKFGKRLREWYTRLVKGSAHK